MRRNGWLLSASLAPFVFLGVVLTISVFGAIGGIPLLLIVGRPWWIGTTVGLGRRHPETLRLGGRIHLVGCALLQAAVYVGCVVVGWNDLDQLLDVSAALVWLFGVVACAVGTLGLVRHPAPATPDTIGKSN